MSSEWSMVNGPAHRRLPQLALISAEKKRNHRDTPGARRGTEKEKGWATKPRRHQGAQRIKREAR